MTLFKPKQITCPKDTWVRIISNFGRGFPQTFKVSFNTADGSMVSGTYKENRYAWIFPRPPVEGTLSPTMSFRRFWINGIYSADVRTDQEATAYVDGGIGKLVVFCLIFFLFLASLAYAMLGFLK